MDLDIIDDLVGGTTSRNNEPQPVSKSIRFANYAVDKLVYVVWILILIGIDEWFIPENTVSQENFSLFGGLNLFLFPILYYASMEAIFGQTLGKMVTKTKVVMHYGDDVTFGYAFLRSLVRLVPFYQFSVLLGGDGRGWHDAWTQTMVVQKNQPVQNDFV